jgi:uncharacterized protein YqgV (UPF0045/DUF77 family)
MQEIIDMIKECRQALVYVKGHIKANPTSTDASHWVGVKKRLEEKIERLEECLHNGEYNG